MKYIFLDTNIFLHFRYYDEIAWENILGNTQYAIVVAAIVIDELDAQKSASSKKTAKRAKAILAKFDKIIDGEITNSNVQLLSEIPDEQVFVENNLSKSHQDNHLLAAILNFTTGLGDEKILITNDTGARLRAKNLNIKCIKLPDDYRLEEELDESEIQMRNLIQENEKLKKRFPKVSLSFHNSTNLLTHTPIELNKAEFIEKEKQKNRQEYPFYKKEAELTQFERIALTPLNRVSDERVEAYNTKLQHYYNQYDGYLEDLYEHNIYLTSCLEIELFLNNVGSSPAEDIDVHLHFPDGFELTKKLKKEPLLPEPPLEPKSFWDMSPYAGFIGHSEHFPIINNNYQIPNINDNKPRLTKIKKTNSYDVEFKIKSGLFDFDKAYNSWNGFSTNDRCTNAYDGLTKQMDGQEVYAIMLPVPNGKPIAQQVINAATGGTFGEHSLMAIEHLFHHIPEITAMFEPDLTLPSQFLRFQGDKVNFCKNLVPTFGDEPFQVFKPIFDFIVSKIPQN